MRYLRQPWHLSRRTLVSVFWSQARSHCCESVDPWLCSNLLHVGDALGAHAVNAAAAPLDFGAKPPERKFSHPNPLCASMSECEEVWFLNNRSRNSPQLSLGISYPWSFETDGRLAARSHLRLPFCHAAAAQLIRARLCSFLAPAAPARPLCSRCWGIG